MSNDEMLIPYFWRCSFLFLLGLLIYGQTFQADFVFDDYMFILNNPDIRDFSHVPLIWHTFPMTRLIGFYSFALNYFFNQYSPFGYHVFNFVVHLIAVGLVWALADVLLKITKWLPQDSFSKEIPFIIAVLFLVHPCQTQAVSYISQRFESMATVFYLGTVYCYLCARISTQLMHQIFLFGLSGLLCILGILTKEVVITVPAMILACEWILFPKTDHKRWWIVLVAAGFLLSVFFLKMLHLQVTSFGVFLKPISSDSHDGDILTTAHYLLTQMRVFLTFLRLLALPIHQNLDYDYPASTGLLHPPLTLVGLCLIGLIIFLIIKLRRSVPLIAFGLAWILITFSINLVPRANVIFEHKLYLISFGFFLSMVILLSVLIRDRRTLGVILLCIITALSFASFQRNKVWQNGISLWNDTVLKSPHKVRPYVNRGYFLYHQGYVALAISDYKKALQLDPNYASAYNNLGWAYYNQGKLSQAFYNYSKAIEKDPNLSKARYNRAIVYCRLGKYSQAILDFNQGIAIDPDHTDSYYNRGLAYYTEGNFAQALSDYNKAVEIDPLDADVYNNRGLAYYNQNKMSQAISDYNKAIEQEPDLAKAYYNRALVYYYQDKIPQALADFNKAIELNPEDVGSYSQRGRIAAQQGNFAQALSDCNKIIGINPKYVEVYYNRGNVYMKQNRLPQALSDYDKAIQMNPGYTDAYNNRGLVWQSQGHFMQAVSDYSKAIETNPRYVDAYNNRAVTYYRLKEYGKAWADVHKAEELGYAVNPDFISALKKASNS